MRRMRPQKKRRGQAMVEFALMLPWLLFLFVGVADFGFYSYAAICTQNAARAAALANSISGGADNTGACAVAIQEMNSLPGNARTISSCVTGTCPSTTGTVSQTTPLAVTSCAVAGPDGGAAVRVIVTYQSLSMIPIPGVLMGQLTMTRQVDVPILSLIPVSN